MTNRNREQLSFPGCKGRKVEDDKNGSVTLEFEASGKVEIERWINSWGEDVEVVRMGCGEKSFRYQL